MIVIRNKVPENAIRAGDEKEKAEIASGIRLIATDGAQVVSALGHPGCSFARGIQLDLGWMRVFNLLDDA